MGELRIWNDGLGASVLAKIIYRLNGIVLESTLGERYLEIPYNVHFPNFFLNEVKKYFKLSNLDFIKNIH